MLLSDYIEDNWGMRLVLEHFFKGGGGEKHPLCEQYLNTGFPLKARTLF